MDYNTKMLMFSMGIFIFLIYLVVFGVLHGGVGIFLWSITGLILALGAGLIVEKY